MLDSAKSISLHDSRLKIKMCGHSLIDADEAGPGYQCFHQHNFWQINLCHHGSIDIELKNCKWTIRQGDIVIFPPGIYHGFNYISGEKFGCFSFKFDLTDLVLPTKPSAILLTEESNRQQRQQIIATVSQLFYAFFSQDLTGKPLQFFPPVDAPYTGILEDLLFGILRYSLQEHDLCWEKDLAHQIRNYVIQANGAPVSIPEIARHLGYSESHLLKLIKQQTGRSTKELVDEERVSLAKKFLHYSSLNISELAEHMGFSDLIYFCRFFKKFTGETPSGYRKKLRALHQ